MLGETFLAPIRVWLALVAGLVPASVAGGLVIPLPLAVNLWANPHLAHK